MERTSLRHFKRGALVAATMLTLLPSSESVAMAAAAPGYATAEKTASFADRIHVGPSVHVSAAIPDVGHWETILSAHAEKPYLLACSLTDRDYPWPGNINYMPCYVSFDAGRSWSEPIREISGASLDPNVVHGLGRDVYAAGQGVPGLIVERSDDFGKTFRKVSIVAPEGLMDRTYFGVDRGNGPSRGTLYLRGGGNSRQCFFTSTDQGKTFVAREADCKGKTPLNFVNFSDGSLGQMLWDELIERDLNKGRKASGQPENWPITFVTYKDGKEEKRGKIGDVFWKTPEVASPTAAVDTTDGPFKDRVYATWMDIRSGRNEILFARSRDGGRSWSQPSVINDDRAPARKEDRSGHSTPVVAVNKDGVIMIVWYASLDGRFGYGWQMRGVVSFDGGETFSPSFAVSEAVDNLSSLEYPFSTSIISSTRLIANMAGEGEKRHTSGLTATPDGSFYAVWVDGRSGVMQLWGANLSVDGKATRNGLAAPDDYEEISSRLKANSVSSSFDHKGGILTYNLKFTNASKEILRGPFVLQVSDIRNIDVVAQAVDTANSQTGRGSIWRFNVGSRGNLLPPGETTMPFEIKFKLTDKELRELDAPNGIDIKWRILGRIAKR